MGRQPKISAEELQWRAESDAQTLKRAQEIMQDKNRLKRAQKYIKKELDALTSVAKTAGVVKATTPAKKATTPAKKVTTKKGGKK